MKTDIRVRGLAPEAVLADAIASLAHAHLGRFGADVFSVHVRLTDVNGPRGGVDMLASITVYGPRIGAVTIDDVHQAPRVAVASALERMEQVVQRDLSRLRSFRPGRVGASLAMAR